MLSRHPSPEPASPAAVLALGFRPFFLAAALQAALWIPFWLISLSGTIALGLDAHWHGHEMVFGFSLAVIAGFLLTAARNWTGQPSPSGLPLLALVMLWAAGRVAYLFSGSLPFPLVAAVDLAFIPAVAFFVGRMIVNSKNWRNLGFVILLGILGAANLWFWLGDPYRANTLGVFVVIMIIVLMGGRVIPFFTANGLGIDVRKKSALDWVAVGMTGLAAVAIVAFPAESLTAVLAGAAGVANLVRMWGWGSLRTTAKPILWVLHLGYLFIPVGFMLYGLGLFVPTVGTAPLHALTAGSIGLLTLGMMARVSLGHTGRPLQVAPLVTAAFIAVLAGATLRVFGAGFFPLYYLQLLVVSGVLWSAGFAIFFIWYAPILTTPRPDGRPG
jgi:uncharacterized protein involved in response to NO